MKIGSKKYNEDASNKYACDSLRTTNYKCDKPTQSKNKDKPNQGECEYHEGISITPKCGMNENGDKYCNLGEADVELNEVFYECIIVYKIHFKRRNR